MSLGQPPRLRSKVKHILSSTMLCCGRRKEVREAEALCEEAGGCRRQPQQRAPAPAHHRLMPEMVVQSDFRKVSGISTEIFRQIEAVEKQALDAGAAEAVERRGETLVRLLDPGSLGRAGAEAARRYLRLADPHHAVQFVEIVKRPGQTLGLYIREGRQTDQEEGVFISRIALESAVYSSGLLKVEDEILAVNLVDVRRVSLDDVVIIMSIPRRLVLTVRSRAHRPAPDHRHRLLHRQQQQPVLVLKKEFREEAPEDYPDWMRHRTQVLLHPAAPALPPPPPPDVAPYYYTMPAKAPEPMWGGGVMTRQPTGPPAFPASLQPLAEQVGPIALQPLAEQIGASLTAASSLQGRFHAEPTDPRRLFAARSERFRLEGQGRRLLRTESEQRLSTLGPDDRFRSLGRTPPPLRRSGSGLVVSAHRRRDELPPQVAARRHRALDGSASDTEAPPFLFGQAASGARSHSLPRVRMSEMDFRRFQQQPGRALLYDSQSDSDGALSAPELPPIAARRPNRARRMTSPIFTSAEYSRWLTRAPAAVCTPRRPGTTAAATAPRLPRSARSAESLLDRLKQEEEGRGPAAWPGGRRLMRSASELGAAPPGVIEYLRQIPHPTPASEERLQRLLALNPRDFLKYRPERESETVLGGNDAFSGLLWVHLLAGRGLRSTGGGGPFRDLYCVLECDRVHRARTVVRSGEHAFDWDEVFELELADAREIAFLLYSWDPQLRHKLCYKGSLHLLTLLRESPAHSLALRMEPRGTLYLKLRYRDPRQTFQRQPALAAPDHRPPVFGGALEATVAREGGAVAVPLVVRRCCEEVERRGLDIVGIYRLCGSAVRKKTLRDAFERDAAAVRLAGDHVPDINVVTSVLKDYLRELPEPLLPKGLFEMLLDGLSVCLPQDPEGNAKLMFAILDCLPKVNRCTVVFLLDHLKTVAGHSDRNKMGSAGLALAFGPLAVCHTESGAPAPLIAPPVRLFQYLLDMWPAPSNSRVVAGGGKQQQQQQQQQRRLPESSC